MTTSILWTKRLGKRNLRKLPSTIGYGSTIKLHFGCGEWNFCPLELLPLIGCQVNPRMYRKRNTRNFTRPWQRIRWPKLWVGRTSRCVNPGGAAMMLIREGRHWFRRVIPRNHVYPGSAAERLLAKNHERAEQCPTHGQESLHYG